MSIEAMKQALEALELMYACYAHPDWISHKQQEKKILAQCVATTMTLRQALAKQKPVAWIHTGGHVQVRNPTWADGIADGYTREKGWTPLYTTSPAAPVQEFVCSTGLCHYKSAAPAAQPALKPLTGQQIRALWEQEVKPERSTAHFFTAFARAIEAAHGIKENT